MSLDKWLQFGWLKTHATSPEEIGDLWRVAGRNLADSAVGAISEDGRFAFAYGAGLTLATIALYAIGYEPAKGESHHLRAIQSLAFTVGLEKGMLNTFETFRKKRNTGLYDRAGAVTEADVAAMIQIASTLRTKVAAWLRASHPTLAKGVV